MNKSGLDNCIGRTVHNRVCRCRFVIGRERPGQQSEVATLIQQTLEQERRQRELLEQQYAQYDADDDEVMTRHDPDHHTGKVLCFQRLDKKSITLY